MLIAYIQEAGEKFSASGLFYRGSPCCLTPSGQMFEAFLANWVLLEHLPVEGVDQRTELTQRAPPVPHRGPQSQSNCDGVMSRPSTNRQGYPPPREVSVLEDRGWGWAVGSSGLSLDRCRVFIL